MALDDFIEKVRGRDLVSHTYDERVGNQKKAREDLERAVGPFVTPEEIRTQTYLEPERLESLKDIMDREAIRYIQSGEGRQLVDAIKDEKLKKTIALLQPVKMSGDNSKYFNAHQHAYKVQELVNEIQKDGGVTEESVKKLKKLEEDEIKREVEKVKDELKKKLEADTKLHLTKEDINGGVNADGKKVGGYVALVGNITKIMEEKRFAHLREEGPVAPAVYILNRAAEELYGLFPEADRGKAVANYARKNVLALVKSGDDSARVAANYVARVGK